MTWIDKQLEPYRGAGEINIARHLNAHPSTEITDQDLESLEKTVAGRKILFQAYEEQPGSEAMQALIQQIKEAALGEPVA